MIPSLIKKCCEIQHFSKVAALIELRLSNGGRILGHGYSLVVNSDNEEGNKCHLQIGFSTATVYKINKWTLRSIVFKEVGHPKAFCYSF